MEPKNLRVDFHTHIIPHDLPDYAAKYNDSRFPVLNHQCECGAEILKDDKVFRKITDHAWDPKKRIEDMDKENIDIQVLSPIPVTLSYWADDSEGLEMSKYQNDFISSVVRQHPDRFVGLGTVPLQNTEEAIKEMHRAVNENGLRGIQIGSNVNGLNLDDENLYPFFAEAAKKGVPLFVHPWQTLGGERLQKYNTMYTVGMPSETALAAASVIMSGLLSKLPNLKLCFAHGGGSLPYILPRMDKGWEVWPDLRKTEKLPSYYAKQLYYDSLVYDPVNLNYMIQKFGAEKIISGSDYPFLLRESPAGRVVDNLTVSDEEKQLMLGQNAIRFLGL